MSCVLYFFTESPSFCHFLLIFISNSIISKCNPICQRVIKQVNDSILLIKITNGKFIVKLDIQDVLSGLLKTEFLTVNRSNNVKWIIKSIIQIYIISTIRKLTKKQYLILMKINADDIFSLIVVPCFHSRLLSLFYIKL